MLADRGEKQVQLADHVPVRCFAGELGVQVGKVALQQGPVYLRQPVHVHGRRGEERREAPERQDAQGRRLGHLPGR